MFCGLRQGRDAADVGRGGQRDQVRHRRQPELAGHVEDERRQHQADHVVHEEGGEDPGGSQHGREQAKGRARPAHGPDGHQVKEPRQPQVGGDDHHAEEER
jgi:hypothetical protein